MQPVDSLSDEPISRLGPLPRNSVLPTDTVLDALKLMQESRHGYVVVLEGQVPVGVLTERDILRRMGTSQPLNVPIARAISGQVWSLRETDSVKTAIERMNHHQCRHLVVVSESNELIGVLSVRRIVRALVELFPAAVYNLPPVANQVQKDREGA